MSDQYGEDFPYPPELPDGTLVIFTGPEHVRDLTGLTVEHPGMIAGAAEKHADVRWVDKQGWWVHQGVFDPRWLSVIDEGEFAVRSAALRSSSWVGFAESAPGNRQI